MDPGAVDAVTVTDGETIKHIRVGDNGSFEIVATAFKRSDLDVSVQGPSKRPVAYRLLDEGSGLYRVEFTTTEVGNYFVDLAVGGAKVPGSPFISKAYDADLIRVTDVPNGVVGQACQFKVDASHAGEGQLEISICDGEVPNQVQVLGGGRCLVSFTPERAMKHTIDIKFNGDTVRGCPFVCNVTDTSRVSVNLRQLELIAVDKPASFLIQVDGSTSAELAVSVRAPSHSTLPVKVTGNTRSGFRAEFMPKEIGPHTILVEYNGTPVGGTPFTSKVYDVKRVYVSPLPKGSIGKSLQFTVDAGQAGEGNLEITISAQGRNIPTQVHPQGSARFLVSFVPLEATDHIVSISFNKEPVPGSPFVAHVATDPNRLHVSGQSLASTPVGKPAYFTISNVTGTVEDVEVNVEGPSGSSVPATLKDVGERQVRAEFIPKQAGEHRIHILYGSEAVPGSPFSCKVYDVSMIRVREMSRGVVGRPVTFLVETSQAGPGNLEVTVNQGQVPTSAQSQGHHTYAISFTPKEPVDHKVELKFNGEDVPGSPFKCQILDASRVTASGDGLEKVAVGRKATFYIHSQEPSGGDMSVRIASPARQSVPHSLTEIGEGRYAVEFAPQDVGDHTVEIRYADLPIPGSPFLVKAYDSSKIKVDDVTSGVVGKPVYFTIDASQAGAGNLEIIVSVNNKNVPNYVQSEGNAKFKVNFKPQEAATHLLSVRFNGEAVPGSPFSCRVTDSSLLLVSGDALKMAAVGKPAVISVDPRGCDMTHCLISVLTPLGTNLPLSLKHNPNGIIQAEFTPAEVGPHSISLTLDGEHVAGSPFTCNSYDVEKVQVTGLGNSKVGKPVTFTVDASQAGEGTLELVVTTAKASVRAEVTARSRGLYDVTFTPQEPIAHFVNVTFNEEDVKGSPFKCEVRDLDAKELKRLKRTESKMVAVQGEGLQEVCVGQVARFEIDCKGMDGDVDVKVTAPDDTPLPSRLTRLRNGMVYRAEYRPVMIGLHRIEVYHRGHIISKTPFVVEVADPSKVKVLGIKEGQVGKDSVFKVDSSKAGRGTLTIAVKAAGQEVKHSLRDVGWGSHEVIFTPSIPVIHLLTVQYNGIPLNDSPFEIPVANPFSGKMVTASGTGLYQSKVGKATTFVIETMSKNSEDFDVLVSGPGGSAIPVKCYQQKDGNLLAEFQATSAGEHNVEIFYLGNQIAGSPFRCQVYDASKVKLGELPGQPFQINDRVSFKVDRSLAGIAELSVNVQSPLGKQLPLEVKALEGGKGEVIHLTPATAGKYKINIHFGEDEVPGSPLIFMVEESGGARAYGSGLSRGEVGKAALFKIDAHGLTGSPHVQVDGPDSVAVSDIVEKNSVYTVTFVPMEVGVFDVTVTWNGREIPGSPWHPNVVDSSKIRVIGGWESLSDESGRLEFTQDDEKRITFDTSQAGPGKLRAELTGPTGSVIEIAPTLAPAGKRVHLVVRPVEDGEHELEVFWADVSLGKRAAIVHSAAAHTKVILRGHGLATAKCNHRAEFSIDGSGVGQGAPEVSLVGPKRDVRVTLENLGGNKWRASYVPTVPGSYLLSVLWNGRQVKGCPLKISVVPSTDAAKVLVTGLRGAPFGREVSCGIDTRRAGPGELEAGCSGPLKTAFCELYDHQDGTFTLNIQPAEPGRHSLWVKYSGEEVPGSPFPFTVSAAPDASKVRVAGPGIESGLLPTYQSRFMCDTRGAGAGQLTVKVRGPKGAFRVEMQRESSKDRIIQCRYNPTEPGEYRIEVKWSGQHVPGSPFELHIFDTQEELHRFLQESKTGVYTSDIAGSTHYSQIGSYGPYRPNSAPLKDGNVML